jgi:nitric oxide dioxygenase
MDKHFVKDLNKLMKFSKEGIFSTVIAKSENYNYTLMYLSKDTSMYNYNFLILQ